MKLIRVRHSYKFTLLQDHEFKFETPLVPKYGEFVSVNPFGTIKLYSNYSWDGATGAFDTSDCLVPSAEHDALYQLIRLGAYSKSKRRAADVRYFKEVRKRGMCLPRAVLHYVVIRVFGRFKWGKHVTELLVW